MSNYPDECMRCGQTADLATYPMRYGEDMYVCPECWGWLETEAEANFERWRESQHD